MDGSNAAPLSNEEDQTIDARQAREGRASENLRGCQEFDDHCTKEKILHLLRLKIRKNARFLFELRHLRQNSGKRFGNQSNSII